MSDIRNPYEVLRIPNFASEEVIKRSYRTLALTHHPDRGGDGELMKEINSSYDLLTHHKAEIDEALRRALMPRPVVVVYTWAGGNGWTNATATATNFW